MSAAAVVRLDRARAELLTTRLREALDLAVDLVAELHAHEGWRAMGYSSWPEYCTAELPQLAVIVRGLPKPERQAKVSELRAGGMSLRDVAQVTGLAPNTVRTDAAAGGVVLTMVRGRDGALRSATAAAAPARRRRSTTDRVLELVAAAGADGVTVREVCAGAKLHHGQASGTLSRLVAAGRLHYAPPARRGLHGRFLAVD